MKSNAVPGLVSVVVASYNHAGYLTRRMDSLVGQTYPEIEIIVIDDRSPDNSVEILRRYEAHPKVRLVVRETNGGWVAVSNQGIDLARGEFILFGNCDDSCDSRLVERLVAAHRLHPTAGLAFCRSLLVDESGRSMGDDYSIREPEFRARCTADTLLTAAEAVRFLLRSCVIPNLSAVLFRAEGFARVGQLSADYRVCSDWELFFRFVTVYDVAYVADPLNHFRQHATTIRSSTRERVVYGEYIRLLLTQISIVHLTIPEKALARAHVMYLWMAHVFQPIRAGFHDIPFHSSIVWKHDRAALVWVLPSAAKRIARIIIGLLLGQKTRRIVN
jgi:glycosyltransferase involved in cell wall biosynthesis